MTVKSKVWLACAHQGRSAKRISTKWIPGGFWGFLPMPLGASLEVLSSVFAARAREPGKKMKVNAPGQIRFCDEYERLLEEFLLSLGKWKQVEASDRAKVQAEGSSEMMAARREYVWALVALQGHSRECSLCEETLRARINVPDRNASAAESSVS
jgi:hypothetical protein